VDSESFDATMIVSNRTRMFGFANYGVVQGTTFGCAVSTASEGFLKGYSSVFKAFDGEWTNPKNKRQVAKALLNVRLSKKQKTEAHAAFLKLLNSLEADGIDLATAINIIFDAAKESGSGVIEISINEA
jgi:hypothetical protein